MVCASVLIVQTAPDPSQNVTDLCSRRQQPSNTQTQTRLIKVDVVVIDSHGAPIRSLTIPLARIRSSGYAATRLLISELCRSMRVPALSRLFVEVVARPSAVVRFAVHRKSGAL
jgi:hypothetical protein